MKQEKLVSVIINAYNSEKFVSSAIESVLNQSYSNFEIIFWDNKSNDHTSKIINKYTDNRIKYFLAKKHTSLGQARNFAIREAKGEFIAFLDSDDLWLPNKLKLQIPLFNNPKIGLVYSNSLFFNSKGETRQAFKKILPCKGLCFKKLLSRYFLSIETVIIRKQALNEQDTWFNNNYNMIEEADLFRRIAYNWEIDGIIDVLAKWRVHSNSLTYKNPNLLKSESIDMINNFEKIYPNFKKNFNFEIKELFKLIHQYEARNFWFKGNKWPLVKYLFNEKSFKFIFFGFIVFLLPVSLAKFIMKLRGDVFPYEY